MKVTVAVVVVCALLLSGCGGGSSSSKSSAITVSISPVGATLNQGQTVQFTATVSGSNNTAVTWDVNGTAGGTASTGTISSSGLYTAPATLTTASVVTITAVSSADTTKTGVATVTLNPPPAPFVPGLVVNPNSVTLPGGAQQTFNATANGASVSATWTVSCNSPNAADCGTITTDANGNGIYVAPLAPPANGGITVTATAANTNPGSASVTVQYSNQSVFGQYAFQVAALGTSGAFNATTGSVKFDGAGNVTGGELDATGSIQTAITGGTYHVGSDGRGTITAQTASGNVVFQFALQNHSHADAVTFAGTGAFASLAAAGTLDLQDPTQFTAATVSGNFAFLMTGATTGHLPGSLQRAGVLVADGVSAITGGLMDQNDAGTATNPTLAGAFTAPDANGRGVLTINTLAVAYYIVDATRAVLLDTTASSPAAGVATKQVAGPFAAANFNAAYVFTMLGVSVNGPSGTGGIVAPDGTSAFKTANPAPVIDVNDNGNPSLGQAFASAGSYAVTDAATGRTTMTWTETTGPKSLAFYPAASGTLYVISLDAFSESGTAYAQTPIGYANAAVSGTFAARGAGTQFVPAGPAAFAGIIVPSGGSSLSGTLDVTPSTAGAALIGTYSFTTNGRATITSSASSAALPSSNFTAYAVSSGRLLLLETDSSRVLTGTMEKR